MAPMYRVLGFWTLVIPLSVAFAGHMTGIRIIVFHPNHCFRISRLLELLRENIYINVLRGYMLISFVGFTYWTVFVMGNPF